MKIIFARQSYQNGTASQQRLVNFYAESNPEESNEPVTLIGAPGTKDFVTVGSGPIRGAEKVGASVYAISGSEVYKIESDGSTADIGDINDDGGMCQTAHDGTNMVALSGTRGWVITGTSVTEITDSDFQAASDVTWQDGRFIFVEQGSGRFFISQNGVPGSIDGTEFATAEGNPDDLVACLSDHRQIVLFGERSIEFWFNSGAADFPFERIQGAVIELGCAAVGSVVQLDNSFYWLADDLTVRRAVNLDPVRISTHGIEKQVESYGDVSDARAFAYTQGGHLFYCIIFPGKGAFVFDQATGLWHERSSYGYADWRASVYVRAFNKHLIGDWQSGRIGELDLATPTEWGGTLRSEAVTAPITKDGRLVRHARLDIDMDSGTNTDTVVPKAMLDWSDDGGRTFEPQVIEQSFGGKGVFDAQLRFRRLGASKRRVYRLAISDAAPRNVVSAYLQAR